MLRLAIGPGKLGPDPVEMRLEPRRHLQRAAFDLGEAVLLETIMHRPADRAAPDEQRPAVGMPVGMIPGRCHANDVRPK